MNTIENLKGVLQKETSKKLKRILYLGTKVVLYYEIWDYVVMLS
jgi:hypothetical protein